MTDPARAAQPPLGNDTSFDQYDDAQNWGDPFFRSDAQVRFFDGIADRLVAEIAPATVLDAGCAIGLLVEALRARGVDATGIDISPYAIAQAPDGVRPYCRQGSIAEELPRRYDLIVSIEVVQHTQPREADAAIANFCRHTDDVVFSSSPVDYTRPSHTTVRPTEDWAVAFAQHGFYRDVDFDGSLITPWAIRFRRSAEPFHRIVRGYERRFSELMRERKDTRKYAIEVQKQLAAQLDRVEHLWRGGHGPSELTDVPVLETGARDGAGAGRSASAVPTADLQRFEQAVAALRRAETELAQARDRIFHMERSAFWRARRLWQRIRGSR